MEQTACARRGVCARKREVLRVGALKKEVWRVGARERRGMDNYSQREKWSVESWSQRVQWWLETDGDLGGKQIVESKSDENAS
ncbi:MAG: hypothetical protein MJE68_25580 [Proteobacteria bacterium]|nr:hypothetical protein [Pseudomonadota bacterium]